MEVATSLVRKKKMGRNDEQTLPNLNSAHRLSQVKCQPVRTVYIKQVKGFLFGHIINILLTELSRSVWVNLDLGHEYRPHRVRSVPFDLVQDSPIQTSCLVNKR